MFRHELTLQADFLKFNLSHTEEVFSVYSRIPDSYIYRVNN